MKEDWYGLIYLLVLYIIIAVLAVMAIRQHSDYENLAFRYKTVQMRINAGNLSSRTTGIYYPSIDWFCVRADRPYSEVMQTCNHEYLHYEYKDDWQHFREDDG